MLPKWRGRGGVVEVPAADVWQFLPLVALSGGEVAVGIEDRVDVPGGTGTFFLKTGNFLRKSQKKAKILRKSENISENLKIFQKI